MRAAQGDVEGELRPFFGTGSPTIFVEIYGGINWLVARVIHNSIHLRNRNRNVGRTVGFAFLFLGVGRVATIGHPVQGVVARGLLVGIALVK
jgi:hypothetical protein